MRWALHFDRDAVQAMYTIPKEIWIKAKKIIWALEENPLPPNMQVSADDPSKYWIPLPGDHIVWYEIVDEKHVVRILNIK